MYTYSFIYYAPRKNAIGYLIRTLNYNTTFFLCFERILILLSNTFSTTENTWNITNKSISVRVFFHILTSYLELKKMIKTKKIIEK